jgi:hypothetical protein
LEQQEGRNGKEVHRLDGVPIQLVSVFLRPVQSNQSSGPRSNEEQQQQHMKMGKRKGRKKQRTKGQRQPSGEQGAQGRRGMERGEEHGTVDSLWQWRQWKTSPQQGARIRHRLR